MLRLSSDVFSVLRTCPEEDQRVFTVVNVTDRACRVEVPLARLGTEDVRWYDLVSGVEGMVDEGLVYVSTEPYGVVRLEPFRKGTANLSPAAR